MTKGKRIVRLTDVKALLVEDPDVLRPLVQAVLQELLEANGESCLRPIRALAVATHENRLEANRYLNLDDLREHKKEALRMAA